MRLSTGLLLAALGLAANACGNGTIKTTGGSNGSSGAARGTSGGSGSGTGSNGGSTGGSITPAGDAGVCNSACAAGQFCASTGDCVQCLSNANCSATPSAAYCDTRSGSLSLYGLCVQCIQSSECGSGMSCDPANDICVSTCTATSCTANSQSCDPTSGACVACLTTSDCPMQQFCNTVTLSCVSCLQPSDCPGGIGCYQGVCGQCNVASDCPGSQTCASGVCTCATDQACPAAAPSCFLDGGPGVCGCGSSSSCTGANAVCDPSQGFEGACVPNCVGSGCQGVTDTGPAVCDTNSGLCVQCLSAAQCTNPLAPFCLLGSCATCAADADCGADAGTPYCFQGLCVQCYSPSQCAQGSPGCNSLSGNCGSCWVNSDCPAPDGCGVNTSTCSPFCGTVAASSAPDCADCATSADCGGGSAICNVDAGSCM